MLSLYTSEEALRTIAMREDLEDDFAVSEDTVTEDDDEKEAETDLTEGEE